MRATKTYPPSTGTCRWLEDHPNGNRWLDINGQQYELEWTRTGALALYVLHEWPEPEVVRYLLTDDGCTCPDATYRPGRRKTCKHWMAVHAALRVRPYNPCPF